MKQPELGNKVLELRQSLGLTQAELAERSNVSLRTIQRVEALEVTPRGYTIKAIFESLGYSPRQLAKKDAKTGTRTNWKKRIDDLFTHIRELFNLKTNAMKKLSILTFAVALFAGLFFVNLSSNAQNASILGTWKLVEQNGKSLPKGYSQIKYITPSRYIWTLTDAKGNILNGAGGTYEIKGNTFKGRADMVMPRMKNFYKYNTKWEINIYNNKILVQKGKMRDEEVVEVWERID